MCIVFSYYVLCGHIFIIIDKKYFISSTKWQHKKTHMLHHFIITLQKTAKTASKINRFVWMQRDLKSLAILCTQFVSYYSYLFSAVLHRRWACKGELLINYPFLGRNKPYTQAQAQKQGFFCVHFYRGRQMNNMVHKNDVNPESISLPSLNA